MKRDTTLAAQAEADAKRKLERYRFTMPDLGPLVAELRRIVSLHDAGAVINALTVGSAIQAARTLDFSIGVAFGEAGSTATKLVTVCRQLPYHKLTPTELDLRARAQAVLRVLYRIERGDTLTDEQARQLAAAADAMEQGAKQKADDPHAPYYPPAHFKNVHGIDPARLRQAIAVKDGRLARVQAGKRWNYSEPDAAKLWPDEVKVPPKA
jgi:hypothetical protein